MARERLYNDGRRAYNKIRRILLLVDLLAPRRCWMHTKDIQEMLCERLGEPLHSRTIRRDLILLESLCMVDHQFEQCRGVKKSMWKINLGRSESLQTAAIKSFDRG